MSESPSSSQALMVIGGIVVCCILMSSSSSAMSMFSTPAEKKEEKKEEKEEIGTITGSGTQPIVVSGGGGVSGITMPGPVITPQITTPPPAPAGTNTQGGGASSQGSTPGGTALIQGTIVQGNFTASQTINRPLNFNESTDKGPNITHRISDGQLIETWGVTDMGATHIKIDQGVFKIESKGAYNYYVKLVGGTLPSVGRINSITLGRYN